MSDEALDKHLQWMDDCDKAQGMDYETWLEERVALLEAENEALSELLSPLVDVELERDKSKETIDALIAIYDLTQRDVENALKKWGGRSKKMKPEELWTAVDYWNDLQKGDLEVETYIRVGDELADYAEQLEAKLLAIECSDCGLTMLTCACDDVENG